MISDRDLSSWLRQAKAHVVDAQNLVSAIEQLLGSTSSLDAARGQPTANRPGDRRGLGPAAIHAAARSAVTTPKNISVAGFTVGNAIRKVLTTDGPLRAHEVAARLESRGWRNERSKTKDARRAVVSSTLSYLTKSKVLRAVSAGGGLTVYALVETPPHALRKIAAAAAKVNGHALDEEFVRVRRPRRKTATSAKSRPTAERIAYALAVRGTDRSLPALITRELDVVGETGLNVRDLLSRLIAVGWQPTAYRPDARLGVELSRLSRKGLVERDHSGERTIYRLVPSTSTEPTEPTATEERSVAPEPNQE